MRRVFIQFYLILVGFFVAVIVCLGLFYKKAIDDVSENYLGDLLTTVLTLIEQDLQTHPQEEWPLILKNFHLDTDFDLDIDPLSAYELDKDSWDALSQGRIVYLPTEQTYIEQIKNSNYLLSVGPISYSYFLKQLRWVDLVMLFGVILSLSIPVYAWLRPLWRDLRSIETAAKQIGTGQMDARVQLAENSTVHPIGQAFDSMADNIKILMEQQETLMQDIAHEIRTPLARLRYRLALISNTDDTTLDHDITEIEHLIDELLFKAKVDAQAPTQNINQTFNAETWLNHCINQAQITTSSDIQWAVHFTLSTSLCRGDEHLLTRALTNLLNNAKRFAQHQIVVSLTESAQHYKLSVADDGVGIPEEQVHHIFQPFYRLDQSRSRQTGGYGLGLAIVSSIAKLHHGSAQVTRSELGGALFSIVWPK
ncbi:MAG: ATP-binding protein [Burkholderiales bacterium]|nr:ATP-binding protein [Burkholderiales bacterium]